MSQFNRFSNRERVEPSTPRNVYRQNNQFDEQQPFVREDVYLSLIAQRDDALMRYQALHAAYELSVSRSEAMQHNNQDMAAHLEASRQQVDQLYARANALQRELQVATIGSRACADAVSQSTSCFAELQRVNQQHADLQQEYNKLHRDYDTQRQSRRAAEHQLDHQATKYQAMKARVASDAGVISDFRVNVKKLNEKIAQLEAAAQVRELRVLTLERQVSAKTSATEPQTPRLRLKNSAAVATVTPIQLAPVVINIDDATNDATIKSEESAGVKTRKQLTMKRQTLLLSEAHDFIDNQNQRTQPQREFDQAWEVAQIVSQMKRQEQK